MSAPGRRRPTAALAPPPRDHRRRPGRRLLLPAALLALVGCSASPVAHSPDLPTAAEALRQLEALPSHADPYYVAAYPYARVYFGDAWSDIDGNGRGTRDDILAGQLLEVSLDMAGNVSRGEFIDPYTGELVEYVRGREESDPVVVDHVVSLWEAWATGAWAWTPEQRLAFANDPLNLVATTYAINELKGPQNAARWHPVTWHEECEFALRVVATKAKYSLEVHDVDRAYLANVLQGCR